MNQKEINDIKEKSREQFKSDGEFLDFLGFEIQKHLVEIDKLREDADPHLASECTDLAILSCMVALQEGFDEETYKKRIKRFHEKIKENKERKIVLAQDNVEENSEEDLELVRL